MEPQEEKKTSRLHEGKPDFTPPLVSQQERALRKQRPHGETNKILNENAEEIIELFYEGETFKSIANRFDVSEGGLHRWRCTGEYSKEIEAALQYSSEAHARLALEILETSRDDGNMAEVARQREISQYHRWMASKRAPKVFGNKEDITVSATTNHQVSPEQFNKLLSTIISKKTEQIENRNQNIEEAEIVEDTDNSDKDFSL